MRKKRQFWCRINFNTKIDIKIYLGHRNSICPTSETWLNSVWYKSRWLLWQQGCLNYVLYRKNDYINPNRVSIIKLMLKYILADRNLRDRRAHYWPVLGTHLWSGCDSKHSLIMFMKRKMITYSKMPKLALCDISDEVKNYVNG